jgi:ketosteroid isomerase-like protein
MKRYTIFLGLLLLVAAAVAAWLLYFSPGARVKRCVRTMAAAFEKKDADTIMSRISKDYNDPAANTYDLVDTMLRNFMIPNFEEIDCEIEEIRVQMQGDGTALAAVKGRISYKIKGMPKRDKFTDESPLVIRFKKQGRAWQVMSFDNIGINANDMMRGFEESLKTFF